MRFLPPAQWFQNNKLGSLVFSVYQLGKDWEDLRAHFNSYSNSTFVKSRNGIRWLSHPEASLSNFLYARGIEHKKGEKYPTEYNNFGNASYGYFDLHFKDINNTFIDVEVWGNKPNGHNEEKYKVVREAKENFNINNKNFIGIHYGDCFSEIRLEEILAPYIGHIAPFVFDEPNDKLLHSTHWSNADELIDYCKKIADDQPDGVFPTEEWLRKRGKWAERDGPAYNTVSIYIKTWIGGVRPLRKILNQEMHSTVAWTKDEALRAYKEWFEKYGFTPGQARNLNLNLTSSEIKKANNLSIAAAKYIGSTDKIHNLLNINPTKKTKWSRETILFEYMRMVNSYSLMPSQIVGLSQDDIDFFSIKKDDIRICKQILSRAKSYFSDSQEVYTLLGVKLVDIRTLKKTE
jgi:hypothetical protein